MEGFLAAQVRSVSGGHTFNVSDLTVLARASFILLALDGFDEVADVALRQKLVNEITKGANRLTTAGEASITTIVTSRPAAFAKSVRFPSEHWTYYELLPLEREQINDYTKKWTKAKGLKAAEEFQLLRILDAKLSEAHTQYLAKNPMQLTILLSLIHIRGPSLPEKRTALYDTYMDMFFSRESEKSQVVRENRELLVDIHRYLAWRLQTAAEAGESGSIEHSVLRVTLFEYLDREGENTAIVGELFDGIIERVGALVSRVQETYEFEVQPLREYFAARHLYETAPYPSDEHECTGDKFDRFKALAGNPYWLNVARFYGGCFNKGELLTLANELTDLAKHRPYHITSHPRGVAMMLLSDWVFSAYQPAVKRVISFVGEHPAFRQLLANKNVLHGDLWPTLPERSGRAEFCDMLWSRLLSTRFLDEKRAIADADADAIVHNSSPKERVIRWQASEKVLPRADWIRLGEYLRVFVAPNLSEIDEFQGELSDDIIERLVASEQYEFLDNPLHFGRAKKLVYMSPRIASMIIDMPAPTHLAKLASMVAIYQYGWALHGTEDIPLKIIIDKRLRGRPSSREADSAAAVTGVANVDELAAHQAYENFLNVDASILATTTGPWVDLINAMQQAWGTSPAVDRIAFIGAGVRSKQEDGLDEDLATTSNLLRAARFVRLKSGAPKWWEKKLAAHAGSSELLRLLLLLILWGTPRTLVKIASQLDIILGSLPDEQWMWLNKEIRALDRFINEETQMMDRRALDALKSIGPRTASFIGRRLSSIDRQDMSRVILTKETDFSGPEGTFALDAMLSLGRDSGKWSVALPSIKALYTGGAVTAVAAVNTRSIPSKVALEVGKDPDSFPLVLIFLADAQLRSMAGAASPKLLEVAKKSNWFLAQAH